MDPWVVSDVLRPNLEWTGFLDVSVIHTVRVEVFLARAMQFIGMCYFLLNFNCYVDVLLLEYVSMNIYWDYQLKKVYLKIGAFIQKKKEKSIYTILCTIWFQIAEMLLFTSQSIDKSFMLGNCVLID